MDYTYQQLSSPCIGEVRKRLKRKQFNQCCYCQQFFSSQVFIEHYISIDENPNLQLNYNNYLGTCSGKYYLNKMIDDKILHCQTSRKSIELHYHPEKSKHKKSIWFQPDGKIVSRNELIDNDLDQILNLNFDELKLLRNNNYNNSFNNIVNDSQILGYNLEEALTKALKMALNNNYEYSRLHYYRFKRILENQIGMRLFIIKLFKKVFIFKVSTFR